MNPYDNAYENPVGQEPEVDTNRGAVPPDQKKNVAVAAGGTTLLAASAIGLGMLDDSDSGSYTSEGDTGAYDDSSENTMPEPPLIVPVANMGNNGVTSMNDLDNLDTFDKAFAAARHLVGPGHYFTWHGNTYNTYYSEELNALSPSERQAFIASLDGQALEVTPTPAHQDHATPAPARRAEPMMAHHEPEAEAAPDATTSNVPEVVPIAAAVGTAAAYPEITPVNDVPEVEPVNTLADNGMGPHIESVDEYMGHQSVGHHDTAEHFDQAHDQFNGHDVGLHVAE